MKQLKTKKAARLTAILLSLLMAIAMLPAGVFAEGEGEEEESIKVYLTVSNKGVIAVDKDGEAMAWREVEVKDLDKDGKYTFDEALVAAHAKYNDPDGYAGGSAGWVTTLWGVPTGGVCSFINNDKATDTVNVAEVKDGDYLVAAIDQDKLLYSDWVSFFDSKSLTVRMGDEFDLTLSGFGAMTTDPASPIADVQIGTWKNGEFTPIKDAETDKDGKVSLSFDEPGTYIVSAKGGAECESQNLFETEETDPTGKAVYGCFDYSVYPLLYEYIGYTEKDYGDGPYPLDEIQWALVDEDDYFDFSDYEDYYFIHSKSILAPLIAPCCIVTVPKEQDAYVTVSNKGLLAQAKDGSAMVEKKVKAADLDGDGQFSLVEVLAEAHREYFEGGEDGFAWQLNKSDSGDYYSVTRLWGQDTWNTLFYINGIGVGSVVDPVGRNDYVYASLNSDDVNYADFTAYFEDGGGSWPCMWDITVHLMGHLGMGYLPEDLEDIDLAGIQIGIWKDGEFEPIPGAVTDEKGKATFFIDEPGEYLLTAQGSVKYAILDYSTGERKEVDCPIMAPYAYYRVEDFASTSKFDQVKETAFSELFEKYDPSNYRGDDQVKVLSKLVQAQSKIAAAKKTADITAAVEAAEAEIKEFTTDAEYKAQEDEFKKLKITGVKAKAGKKKVTVSWKKADVDGYEITCKAGKKKKAVVKKAGTVKKVVKGLTSKKKCTTKVRGYKTIGGNKVYTAWAKAKTVKVK